MPRHTFDIFDEAAPFDLGRSAFDLLRDGQHRHLCPACDDSWWHEDHPEVDCERVWVLECPMDVGRGREAA